jgi:hypothetical protein
MYLRHMSRAMQAAAAAAAAAAVALTLPVLEGQGAPVRELAGAHHPQQLVAGGGNVSGDTG